jgi:cell division protein FtsB
MSANKSDKVLVIRKPDATIHVVELSNQASLMQYNRNLKADKKWTLEVMDREKAEALPHIDPNFVSPGKAVEKLSQLAKENEAKDAEINALKDQLAKLQAGGGAADPGKGAGGSGAKVYDLTVTDTVKLIKKAKDAAAVDAIVGEDDRKGVLDAAEKQKETF